MIEQPLMEGSVFSTLLQGVALTFLSLRILYKEGPRFLPHVFPQLRVENLQVNMQCDQDIRGNCSFTLESHYHPRFPKIAEASLRCQFIEVRASGEHNQRRLNPLDVHWWSFHVPHHWSFELPLNLWMLSFKDTYGHRHYKFALTRANSRIAEMAGK